MVEAQPGRLRDRLEADPGLAAGWRWSPAGGRLAATTAPETAVTLPATGIVTSCEQLARTYLPGAPLPAPGGHGPLPRRAKVAEPGGPVEPRPALRLRPEAAPSTHPSRGG